MKNIITKFKLSCVVKSLYYKLNLKFMALKSILYLFLYYLFILSNIQNGKRVCFFNHHQLIKFFYQYRARVVPENILKKQARDVKLAAAVKDLRAKNKTDRAAARKSATANAEKYFHEYNAADAALIKSKRDAKAAGSFFVEGEPKIAFVIRIRG